MGSHHLATRTRRVLAFAALPLLLAVAGCDRGTTEPDHGEPVSLELQNRASGATLATVEGFGTGAQWQGSLPTLQPGVEIAVNTVFRDAEGHEVALGGEYTAGARFASGSPTNIVALDPHGDHVDIEGLVPGTAQIVFQFMHGDHSDRDFPAIPITVEAAP